MPTFAICTCTFSNQVCQIMSWGHISLTVYQNKAWEIQKIEMFCYTVYCVCYCDSTELKLYFILFWLGCSYMYISYDTLSLRTLLYSGWIKTWVKSKRRFRLVKIIDIYLCADKEKKKVCVFYTHKKRIFVFFLSVCVFTGPVCGKLDAAQKNVTFKSNEVTVIFKSGPHRSGRGFLLSYTTDQNPGVALVVLLYVPQFSKCQICSSNGI